MKHINPLRLAEKLHRLKRGEDMFDMPDTAAYPRFAELLWFIHWQGLQSGGIDKFSERFLESCPDLAGTGAMIQAGAGPWTLEQCLTVWAELRELCERGYAHIPYDFAEWAADKPLRAEEGFGPRYQIALDERDHADLAAGVARFNREYFLSTFAGIARARLPALFVDLCERPDCNRLAPYYFTSLYPALCSYMDRHAETARTKLAPTRIAEMVFKRLDFGHKSKVPTLILGDARIGKTCSESTWAEMYPGRARVVTVPADDSLTAFYYAHAEALGLDYSPATSLKALKFDLDYIIAHSGLFWIYDESHYLIPQNYTAKTPPQRMNWVRSQVIDRGLGVAFFSTRQSYQSSMRKYGKKTQYQFEQWIGRIAPPLILPAALDATELQAAARAMFPAVDTDILDLIVERCSERGTGLQELPGVVEYALFLADRDGRRTPELADVDGAFVEFLGEQIGPVDPPAAIVRESSAKTAPAARGTEPISSDELPSESENHRGLIVA